MPRWNARADKNQQEIMRALREVGASVVSLHRVGQGVPDLLVGYRGQNFLLEVKNPGGKGRRLTEKEAEFIKTWRGQVAVVASPEEALKTIGVEVWEP